MSQIAQARMYLQYESMVHLAAFRGQQNGVEYAEAFEVIRFCIGEFGHVASEGSEGPVGLTSPYAAT